jgi:hypothetical protein
MGRIGAIEPSIGRRGWQLSPVGRLQPPHAPALLVDEHEDVVAYRLARGIRQAPDLIGLDDVARK